ncbi:MAG TPA: FAD-dependent oxidoreductase [Rubrobacter sp.]|nr:FAD-dependent oxidoreductase [Rubrobacter sp.]
MNRDRHLVIVGAGPAGLATARAYREGGGLGRVTMLTPEPYAPYRRPPLTKEYLRGEASREDLPIESDGWYEENSVKLRLLTSIGAIDRERQIVITDKGEALSYDVCVLATGSEPIRPPVPGGDDPDDEDGRELNPTAGPRRRGSEGRRGRERLHWMRGGRIPIDARRSGDPG